MACIGGTPDHLNPTVQCQPIEAATIVSFNFPESRILSYGREFVDGTKVYSAALPAPVRAQISIVWRNVRFRSTVSRRSDANGELSRKL